jgi:membrane associated rhomboid family serine protease
VWVPEFPHVVLPEEVPYLREALAQPQPVTRSPVATGLVVLAAVVAVVALPVLWPLTEEGVAGLIVVAVVAFLLLGAWVAQVSRRRAARRAAEGLGPEQIAERVARFRHAVWLRSRPVTYTKYLGWTIAAVGLCQVVAPASSIDAAGLVKDAVRAGEWWRLATAPLLHAGLLHFWMNYVALFALAQLVEVHAHRAYVPLVFAVSALAGGIASLLLMPHGTSVGASGGILGILGFLIVLVRVRPDAFPPDFARALWRSVGANAVLGLALFFLIDNAAHAGGLLAGAAMGAALLMTPGGRARATAPGRVLQGAGAAALALILPRLVHG